MLRIPALIVAFLLLWTMCACRPEPSLERFDSPSARYAALMYYNYLVEGNYEAYVRALDLQDSLTPRSRTFWMETVAQYADRLRQDKGLVIQVQAVGDSMGEQQAQVFLDVMYADSVVRKISFPLVFREGKWKIR